MINREALREYATGSLWVMPGISSIAALLVGFGLSQVDVGPDSWLWPFAFQGTADDARSLMTDITSTVVTVIALVLGLTVVALQLSSTQFSPRLLRNFLRDRPNQVVLSTFVATFVYTAAGLYTVGIGSGSRTEDFPRLAVSGALLLMFVSLAMVVYYADHLAHSVQVDAIAKRVEDNTLRVVHGHLGSSEEAAPVPPAWAVPLPSTRSGYLQTVHPEELVQVAGKGRLHIRLRVRVGEHIVAGTVLGWAWAETPDVPAPDPAVLAPPLNHAVRIGFERTQEQDAAFGIRQLVDMACKALSPAVNDPYTAVQAVDHLSVIFCALAVRPLGDDVAQSTDGRGVIVVPARRFGDYLATMCGLLRRYGAGEPTLTAALLRLLANCAALLPDDPQRWAALDEQADLILADATRETAQPADLRDVIASGSALKATIAAHLPAGSGLPTDN
jgi:uncharacterized membrane protein